MNLKFIFNLLILTIVVGIGTFFFLSFIGTSEQMWFYGALTFYFVLGAAISVLTQKSLKGSNSAFFRGVMGAMGLRMFLCIIFLAIYLIASKINATEFIVYYLILYLLYTIFEIYQLVIKLRPEKKSESDIATS